MVILVNISLCGYVKNEASGGRVDTGRRVRKLSEWSRQEVIVAWTKMGPIWATF